MTRVVISDGGRKAAGFKDEAVREFEAALAIDPNAAFARANLCRLVICSD